MNHPAFRFHALAAVAALVAATTPGATYSLSFDLGGSNRWGRRGDRSRH